MKIENIKCICSCIRIKERIVQDIEKPLLEYNENPQIGDVVVVEVTDATCGYSTVENIYGRNVQLYDQDIIIGVLGSRKSGTNIYGIIPNGKLAKGDSLDILAQGGIVGVCIQADDTQKKKRAMPVKVLGFVQGLNGEIENIKNFYAEIPEAKVDDIPTIAVFGTSAEVGKTTLMCKILKAVKTKYNMKVACMKVCGTGRYKDLLAYIDSGADYAIDFVDVGLPSTYDIPKLEYQEIVKKMYNMVKEKGEVVLIEVGGDILEGNADSFLEIAKEKNFSNILVISDAMGGRYGAILFEEKKFNVFSWKQNIYSLKERLAKEAVYSYSNKDIEIFLKNVLKAEEER